MAITYTRPDPSSPAAVAAASFSVGRRGFDQNEVRELLRMVAAEIARLQEREAFLERELRTTQRATAPAATVDEDMLTRVLGEEATRLLQTAREGAAQIKARAEEGAARLLREATDEAQRLREAAELEAARKRNDAAADAEAELQMAKQQGREMVKEAQDYRERVLSELGRRRDLARQQIEQLHHGRDRLLQAFERARLVAIDVVAELTPLDEPDVDVNLAPTTGPVPIVVPASQAMPTRVDVGTELAPPQLPAHDVEPGAAGPAPDPGLDPAVDADATVLLARPALDDLAADEPAAPHVAATEDAPAEAVEVVPTSEHGDGAADARGFDVASTIDRLQESPLHDEVTGPATDAVADVPDLTDVTEHHGAAPDELVSGDAQRAADQPADVTAVAGLGTVVDEPIVDEADAEVDAVGGEVDAGQIDAGQIDAGQIEGEPVEGEPVEAAPVEGGTIADAPTNVVKLFRDDRHERAADTAPPAEPAADAAPPAKPSIDELFARLRASRMADVAQRASTDEPLAGAEPAATPGAPAGGEPTTAGDPGEAGEPGDEAAAAASELPPPAASTALGESVTPPTLTSGDRREDSVFLATPDAPPTAVVVDDSPFARRDEQLTPIIVGAARRLKRILADEQNEVLHTLRRPGSVHTLDALVPAEAEHESRYGSAIEGDLLDAALAGASSMGVEPGDIRRELVRGQVTRTAQDVLAAELVRPLRERLARAVADAGGDGAELSASVRTIYREWKNQRIDEQLDDVVRTAFGQGALAATPAGTPIRWVVDPHGPACSDAEDNALGGVIAAGEEFPTAHRCAPAHSGCRCMIVPAT